MLKLFIAPNPLIQIKEMYKDLSNCLLMANVLFHWLKFLKNLFMKHKIKTMQSKTADFDIMDPITFDVVLFLGYRYNLIQLNHG